MLLSRGIAPEPRTGRRPRSSLVSWLGVGLIVYILVLTYLGYTANPSK